MSVVRAFPQPIQPKPPKGLTAAGRKLWSDLQSEYGIRDSGGLLLLEAACRSFDDWTKAGELLDREGMLIPDAKGAKKAHPALRARTDAHRAMLSSLRQLHLDVQPILAPGRPGGSRPTI